jgi:TolA-binding protein
LAAVLIFSCSDNRTAEDMFQDGNDLYKEQKVTRALKTYDKLTNMYPDDDLAVKALYRMAEIYAGDLQEFETCVDKYTYIADEYPSHPDAPKARFMGEYDRAKAEYEKFIRDYPKHSLSESVQFELRNLGKELDEIEELKGIMKSGNNE